MNQARPPEKRKRRSTKEVERLILGAAQKLFAANGFRGTSTREIANTAGVAEVLLFRHFGSKSELYSTSVVAPLTEFLDAWLEEDWSEWETDERRHEEKMYEFLARIYEIVAQNRGLIMSYLAMSVFEPEMVTELEHTQRLRDTLDNLADRSSAALARLRTPGSVNVPVVTRAAIAMVLSMALFHDFGSQSGGAMFTRAEVIGEMTQMVLHGTLERSTAKASTGVAEELRPKRRGTLVDGSLPDSKKRGRPQQDKGTVAGS